MTTGVEMAFNVPDDELSPPPPHVVRDTAENPRSNIAKANLIFFMKTTSEAAYTTESSIWQDCIRSPGEIQHEYFDLLDVSIWQTE